MRIAPSRQTTGARGPAALRIQTSEFKPPTSFVDASPGLLQKVGSGRVNDAEKIDEASEKEERDGKKKGQKEPSEENTLHTRRRLLQDVIRDLAIVTQPWSRRFVDFTIDAERTSLQSQLALSDCVAGCSSLKGEPNILVQSTLYKTGGYDSLTLL